MIDFLFVHFNSLIGTFGYLGVLVVSFVSASTIFFPIPGYVAILAGGYFLNPSLIAFVGALGSAGGELAAYGVGRGGRELMGPAAKKLTIWIERIDLWSRKWNRFLLVYIFALTPLPHDAAGLFFGAVKYSAFNFLLATFLGRLTLFLLIAFGISLFG